MPPAGAVSADAVRLVAALAQQGLTLAVAESLTGGLLAAEIVTVPGASVVFTGAVVAYATPLKASLLGVDAALLAERGAVDAEVARQMADGVRRACAVDGRPADLGIATTGVAGPDPQDGHAPGTVHLGIASARGIRSVALDLAGDRPAIRRAAVERAVAEALAELDATGIADAEYPV
ncbi:nicotinamide-nucleotide amidohydrolase family protein [Agromyces sp. CFH 90414]|uniref:Nicotinamide-nucleotide amidohydrolase family protein n=1 Tax=Agromyces agglutinans TaxID=2662258 RepID=A0A6I2F9S3_9MICO|nr:nicotinamide-nucleotide amidohydrolase family protein [Agromyces agglutinans]MRG61632.1 nicotinamide-nucleotide amidohydrolase family protein [Agromyces agglutinans]